MMKYSSRLWVPVVLALLAVGWSSCGSQEAEHPLDEVTVQLKWLHQAQFAGFYAAEQQGYYASEGLKVTLIPQTEQGSDLIAPVVTGEADFGTVKGIGMIGARAQGHAVRAISTIYRRDPLVYLTMAGSGITRPQDFPGHTIRDQGTSGRMTLHAMLRRTDIDPGLVEPLDMSFDMAPFFAGEVDIWPGFITNEVLSARAQGYELNVILPEDYGVRLYGDILFTTDRLIQNDPDLVLRFLRATLNGWRWAVENSEEAGKLALQYEPSLDAAQQVAQMEASLPLIHTGEDQVGWMREDIWQGMHDLMLEQGLLAGPVDIKDAFTMQFLEDIYGNEP